MITTILLSTLFYINEPVIDMRETASHDARVASQTVFSEEVQIRETSGEWSLIKTPDGYLGWILSEYLTPSEELYESNVEITRLKAHIYGVKDTEWGAIKSLPYGSRLKVTDWTDARWLKIELPDGSEGYLQKGDVGDVCFEPSFWDKSDLVPFSQKFLGLPYTWGGRSSFGYDCSGFVQMLYNQIGVNLLRDSKQQILDNRLTAIEIDELEPGDLVFFGKSAEKIMHVAMYIGNQQIIHTSARENMPWLRISNLSDFEWSGDPKAYYPYRTARQLR